MGITLQALAKTVGGDLINAENLSTEIAAIGLDSSSLAENAIFAAVPGTRTHGASFAQSGQAASAIAILSDPAGAQLLTQLDDHRPLITVPDVRAVLGKASASIYGDPSAHFVLIGVTGTSGKTTTSYLLEQGLIAAGHRVGLIGTTGTRINGQPIPTSLTTPEAPVLQELFSRMLKSGITHVVMEVSSHALSLGRVAGSHFDVAAFTNLSQDHLDFHPTMEDYFAAKSSFFRSGSPLAAAKQVVCVDDSWGQRMAELSGDVQTVSITNLSADFSVRNIKVSESGAQEFEIVLPDESIVPINLALPGAFNIANAMLALAAASRVGIDLAAFSHGLAQVAVPGRMERIDEGQDFLAVVDYAHKPAAVAAVLETLATQIDGRLGIVIGAGGDRDATKRAPMGELAAHGAQLVIVTDDNPRSEVPAEIRKEVLSGALAAAAQSPHQVEVREIGDRAEAIRALVEWAQPGDGIVVAGKGHEVGQLISGVTHHFDDREQVRHALKDKLQRRAEGK